MTKLPLVLFILVSSSWADETVYEPAECIDRVGKMVLFERIKVQFSDEKDIQETCNRGKPYGYDQDREDYRKLGPLGLKDFQLRGLIRHQFYDTLLDSNNFVPKMSINREQFCKRVDIIEELALSGFNCPGAREILRRKILKFDYVGSEYLVACVATGMMIKEAKGCLKVESQNEINSSEKVKSQSENEKNTDIGKGSLHITTPSASAQ